MSVQLRPLTYDNLLEMPDDGKRREVIGGELIVNPAPTAGHQDVVGNLYVLLRTYALASGGHVYLAPFDLLLGRFNVVQPDLMYLSPSRPRVPKEKHALEEPPDLVVEVLSPGSVSIDRARKMALYASFLITKYWIADPMHRLFEVNVLAGDEYAIVEPDAGGLFASREFSGLRIDPAVVFAGLD